MGKVGVDIKQRIDDKQYLEREFNGHVVRLYIICNIPFETKFISKARNEIQVDEQQ
jgi:hypothetical protein